MADIFCLYFFHTRAFARVDDRCTPAMQLTPKTREHRIAAGRARFDARDVPCVCNCAGGTMPLPPRSCARPRLPRFYLHMHMHTSETGDTPSRPKICFERNEVIILT